MKVITFGLLPLYNVIVPEARGAHVLAYTGRPFLDMSSDVLHRNLRCTKCGHRGAATMAPSSVDMQIGQQPFPEL